ncbi:MAG: hypothetical protein LAN71_09800 [Acidobacteriia bacterium]|nr:hypothetical protein [Terriglobia bacterium]
MDMLEKHLRDLFDAVIYCYQKELLMPCLVLLYSGIDVAASLEPSVAQGVGERFEKWVERYMLSGRSLPCTAKEIYAARCAVVHTFTPDSNISKAGSARAIGYAYGNAEVKKLDEATVLSGRQELQVNVHLSDLIEAFHAGYEIYLKEALKDSARWKQVMEHANMWTVSIEPAKVEGYIAAKSSSGDPANPKTRPT